MSKIVSIDVDEVLRAFVDSLRFVYQRVHPTHWTKPITAYKLDPFFQIGKDIFEFYSVLYTDIIYGNAKMMDGADGFTDKLIEAGHTVILNTSQPNTICDKLAMEWVHKQLIPYHAFLFSQDKGLVLPDIHLDDATHHLVRLRERGIRCVAFDRPWNQDWDGERVKTHREFLALLNIS